MEQLKATEVSQERVTELYTLAMELLTNWKNQVDNAIEAGRLNEDEFELFEGIIEGISIPESGEDNES